MCPSDKGGSHEGNPATNSAEREAMIDHAIEKAETGKDPVPRDAPEWAKDLPSPGSKDK